MPGTDGAVTGSSVYSSSIEIAGLPQIKRSSLEIYDTDVLYYLECIYGKGSVAALEGLSVNEEAGRGRYSTAEMLLKQRNDFNALRGKLQQLGIQPLEVEGVGAFCDAAEDTANRSNATRLAEVAQSKRRTGWAVVVSGTCMLVLIILALVLKSWILAGLAVLSFAALFRSLSNVDRLDAERASLRKQTLYWYEVDARDYICPLPVDALRLASDLSSISPEVEINVLSLLYADEYAELPENHGDDDEPPAWFNLDCHERSRYLEHPRRYPILVAKLHDLRLYLHVWPNVGF